MSSDYQSLDQCVLQPLCEASGWYFDHPVCTRWGSYHPLYCLQQRGEVVRSSESARLEELAWVWKLDSVLVCDRFWKCPPCSCVVLGRQVFNTHSQSNPSGSNLWSQPSL